MYGIGWFWCGVVMLVLMVMVWPAAYVLAAVAGACGAPLRSAHRLPLLMLTLQRNGMEWNADFGGLFLVITGFFSFVKNFFTLEPISALIHVSLKSQFLELSGYLLPAVLLGCSCEFVGDER